MHKDVSELHPCLRLMTSAGNPDRGCLQRSANPIASLPGSNQGTTRARIGANHKPWYVIYRDLELTRVMFLETRTLDIGSPYNELLIKATADHPLFSLALVRVKANRGSGKATDL